MNHKPVRYEPPEWCEYIIGTWPTRTMIGFAEMEHGEPGIVIWREAPGGWDPPAFLESRWVHMIVAAAINCALLDFSKCKNWLEWTDDPDPQLG